MIRLALVLSALLASPALATPICGPRAAIVGRLLSAFGETRHGMGLADDNGVVEVFASDETRTWTIIVTAASGLTCLIAAGRAWDGVAEAPPPNL